MSLKIVFLGTSASIPTIERALSAIAIRRKGELLLFDCGEGTQRQMNIAGIKRSSVRKILITHWHGDHVSGLMGLLQTVSKIENAPEIEIFGG